jgi:hypothetical protein
VAVAVTLVTPAGTVNVYSPAELYVVVAVVIASAEPA